MGDRLLFIGLGGAGQRQLRVFRSLLPRAEIYLLRSKKRAPTLNDKMEVIAEDLCALYGAKEVADVEDAVAVRPDVVVVSTPTALHLESASPFLGLARVILIEKPLAATLSDAEPFTRKARDSSTVCFVGYQRRFLGCWRATKMLLSTQALGPLKHGSFVVRSFMPGWHPWENFRELYAARTDLGGGVLLTECHELDLIQWLFGRVGSVFGRAGSWGSFDLPVEDSALVTLDVAVGSSWRPLQLLVDFTSRSVERRTHLEFAEGSVDVNEIDNTVLLHDYRTGETRTETGSRESPFALQAKEIVKILNGDISTTDSDLCDLDSSLGALGIAEAAKTSADSGRTVVPARSSLPAESVPVMNAVIEGVREAFGRNLIAVYGTGSLGYGGFVDGWSDFDIDVIIDVPPDRALVEYERGKEVEKRLQADGFSRVDIRAYSWSHLNERRTPCTFGQCSRAVMLLDSAKLVWGSDIRGKLLRPGIEEMRREALDLGAWLLGKPLEWWRGLPMDDIAAFLSLPARLLYSNHSGKVAGKRQALEFLFTTEPLVLNARTFAWVAWALLLRGGSAGDLLPHGYEQIAAASAREFLFDVYCSLARAGLVATGKPASVDSESEGLVSIEDFELDRGSSCASNKTALSAFALWRAEWGMQLVKASHRTGDLVLGSASDLIEQRLRIAVAESRGVASEDESDPTVATASTDASLTLGPILRRFHQMGLCLRPMAL